MIAHCAILHSIRVMRVKCVIQSFVTIGSALPRWCVKSFQTLCAAAVGHLQVATLFLLSAASQSSVSPSSSLFEGIYFHSCAQLNFRAIGCSECARARANIALDGGVRVRTCTCTPARR